MMESLNRICTKRNSIHESKFKIKIYIEKIENDYRNTVMP